MIPRHQCDNPECRRVHRMLPAFLVPFKHYAEETISGVLDHVVSSDDLDSEQYPSEYTMKRWFYWLRINQHNIDGYLKSIAHRELGFSVELLKSGISLLDRIRSSIPSAWLQTILRFIYNSGNSLQAFY